MSASVVSALAFSGSWRSTWRSTVSAVSVRPSASATFAWSMRLCQRSGRSASACAAKRSVGSCWPRPKWQSARLCFTSGDAESSSFAAA
jgi:hypothetical protein